MGAKTIKRTLANLSKFSDAALETLCQSFRGVKRETYVKQGRIHYKAC